MSLQKTPEMAPVLQEMREMVDKAKLEVKIKYLPEIDKLNEQIKSMSNAEELKEVKSALEEKRKVLRREATETFDAEVAKVKGSKKFKDLRAEANKLGKETKHPGGNYYPLF